MKKLLATFLYLNHPMIAKLEGGKSIMRVEYPRKTEWYLILPCTEMDEDHMCVLISKTPKNSTYHEELRILSDYATRIIKKA